MDNFMYLLSSLFTVYWSPLNKAWKGFDTKQYKDFYIL